jgi:hypothetical protein
MEWETVRVEIGEDADDGGGDRRVDHQCADSRLTVEPYVTQVQETKLGRPDGTARSPRSTELGGTHR